MAAYGRDRNILVFKNGFIDDHSCFTVLTDKTVKPGLPQAGRSLVLIVLYKHLRRNAEEGEAGGTKRVGKQTEEGIKGLAALK